MNCEISVEYGDIADFSCDVLILKYAQAFFGADRFIADLLKPSLKNLNPEPDKFVIIKTREKITPKNVLFVGVVPLYEFEYEEIRKFSRRSIEILSENFSDIQHVAMTVHGAGYGLDEKESFLAQIAGLYDAFGENKAPQNLKHISIVEHNYRRADRLKRILEKNIPSEPFSEIHNLNVEFASMLAIESAGFDSNSKPHIFVAMPYSKEMEDVYRYGIQKPVNAVGFLCERVDMEAFTGDILKRIKSRIESSQLVIADLTGANPNVYLEVGYAWGKQKNTLLIAKSGEELKFDVRGQRCIVYNNISDLEDKLKADLLILSEL